MRIHTEIKNEFLKFCQSFACSCELCKVMIYLFLAENKEIHRGQEAVMGVSYNQKLLYRRH